MNPETLINSFELNQNYTSDGHSVIAGQNFTTYSYKDQPIIKYFFKSQYYIIYKPPFKKSILNILRSYNFYPEYDECDKNVVYRWTYCKSSGNIEDGHSFIKIETMKKWKSEDVVLINSNVPYAVFASKDKANLVIKLLNY